jgi:hypothetical protein
MYVREILSVEAVLRSLENHPDLEIRESPHLHWKAAELALGEVCFLETSLVQNTDSVWCGNRSIVYAGELDGTVAWMLACFLDEHPECRSQRDKNTHGKRIWWGCSHDPASSVLVMALCADGKFPDKWRPIRE